MLHMPGTAFRHRYGIQPFRPKRGRFVCMCSAIPANAHLGFKTLSDSDLCIGVDNHSCVMSMKRALSSDVVGVACRPRVASSQETKVDDGAASCVVMGGHVITLCMFEQEATQKMHRC